MPDSKVMKKPRKAKAPKARADTPAPSEDEDSVFKAPVKVKKARKPKVDEGSVEAKPKRPLTKYQEFVKFHMSGKKLKMSEVALLWKLEKGKVSVA